jgi:hypothetical protein
MDKSLLNIHAFEQFILEQPISTVKDDGQARSMQKTKNSFLI